MDANIGISKNLTVIKYVEKYIKLKYFCLLHFDGVDYQNSKINSYLKLYILFAQNFHPFRKGLLAESLVRNHIQGQETCFGTDVVVHEVQRSNRLFQLFFGGSGSLPEFDRAPGQT